MSLTWRTNCSEKCVVQHRSAESQSSTKAQKIPIALSEFYSRIGKARSGQIIAGDISLDFLGLRRDDPLHYVTDRDNADHPRPLQDRQMANPLFGHYPHTVRGTVARTRRQHLARHDIPYCRIP